MFSERFPSFTLNAHNTLRQYINMLILQKNLINHRQLYIKQLYYYSLVAPVNISVNSAIIVLQLVYKCNGCRARLRSGRLWDGTPIS